MLRPFVVRLMPNAVPCQMFNEYLREGYYPFFTGNREDYYIRIENVVNLILEQEMPLLCGVDPAIR